MGFELYTQVVLKRDLPEDGFKKSDVGTVIERIATIDGEEGYALEIFNTVGDTLRVVVVPASAIRAPSANEIWCARALA